jgi:hypothetical protein
MRNYKREYKLYGGKEKSKKERALRNKARRLAIREGRASKGDGKDVAHKGSLKNPKNVSLQSKSTNRSFSRKGEQGHGPRKKVK